MSMPLEGDALLGGRRMCMKVRTLVRWMTRHEVPNASILDELGIAYAYTAKKNSQVLDWFAQVFNGPPRRKSGTNKWAGRIAKLKDSRLEREGDPK